MRYFRNGSEENCLHEALKRCSLGTHLRTDSCGAPLTRSCTIFFPFQLSQWPPDCLCWGESYTTAKGTNKGFKSHPVGNQQSLTEGRFYFFFLCCFFRGSVSPRRRHSHNAASKFPISPVRMWRGCLILLRLRLPEKWWGHFYIFIGRCANIITGDEGSCRGKKKKDGKKKSASGELHFNSSKITSAIISTKSHQEK